MSVIVGSVINCVLEWEKINSHVISSYKILMLLYFSARFICKCFYFLYFCGYKEDRKNNFSIILGFWVKKIYIIFYFHIVNLFGRPKLLNCINYMNGCYCIIDRS